MLYPLCHHRLRNMALTTCLTWMQEKRLQNFLKGKQLKLLYMASVHNFCSKDLLQRCCDQGPTITMIYTSDCIIGAYILDNYQDKKKVPIILLALKETNILGCKIRPCFPLVRSHHGEFLYDKSSNFQICLEKKKVFISLNVIEKLDLPPDTDISFQECQVFRCEDLLDTRKMTGVNELRESLLSAVRTYKPYRDLVRQVRILLLGPIGAGKSSFFNSVKSAFHGHVTHQAVVGSSRTGMSKQYRTYSIKDGKDGNPLPFILCDSMGLSEEGGLCMEDLLYILKGHISDRYQFNFMKPITQGHGDYIDFPLLGNRIHCVTFVFDVNSVENLSYEMLAKIKRIRRELIKCGVVHVVLLTCVDTMDLIKREDLIDIYKCMPVKLKIEAVHKKLGVALSDIFVVSNYVSEWDLDPLKDVLVLSALRQMLLAADDFLEDLPLKEADTQCAKEKVSV
ncbi:interferon-induced protein 44 isoform X1 [Saccopteryx bilineata]|uniref:interferon-induced protein 44 isoform X1 n=2 Tax=Saccopteryx bilineata TaxID=59482 RepID=UPI00339060B3